MPSTGATPARYVVADVTDRASVDAAIKGADAERGPINILVANAGAAESAPFGKASPDQFRHMFEVNTHRLVHAMQAVLGGMIERGFGRIVAIASTAGLKGYGYVSAYCAAKHAVVGLVRALARRDRQDRRHRQCRLPGLHRYRPRRRKACSASCKRPGARARTRSPACSRARRWAG